MKQIREKSDKLTVLQNLNHFLFQAACMARSNEPDSYNQVVSS